MKRCGMPDGTPVGTVRLLCRDRRLARGLELMLEDMELQVLSREDGQCPDVVLLELTDGEPLQAPEGVPTIALTRRTLLAGIATGYAAILHRPFRLEELEQVVWRCLGVTSQPPERISCTEPVPGLTSAAVLPRLTPTENALYAALRQAGGAPVDRSTLLALLPHGKSSEPRLLDVHICTLRRKLATWPEGGRVEAVRGVGYRLELAYR